MERLKQMVTLLAAGRESEARAAGRELAEAIVRRVREQDEKGE